MIASLELALKTSSMERAEVADIFVENSVPTNDEELAITRTLKGDMNAFNELVLRYERIAYSVAYRLLHSRDAASDAVQESFLKAFRALSSFNHGSFKSWLLRIVMNTCYDYLRHDRRLPTDLLSNEPYDDEEEGNAHQVADTHESPVAFVERMELRKRIELGLRALPVEQRSVLVLADMHGYSYQEISEITGTSVGTVKSRISRARLKMRDFLLEQQSFIMLYATNLEAYPKTLLAMGLIYAVLIVTFVVIIRDFKRRLIGNHEKLIVWSAIYGLILLAMVVLPKPGGAETCMSGQASPLSNCSNR